MGSYREVIPTCIVKLSRVQRSLKNENDGLASAIIDIENQLQNEFKYAYRQILGLYKTSLITKLKNKEKSLNSKLINFNQVDIYQKLLKDAEIQKFGSKTELMSRAPMRSTASSSSHRGRDVSDSCSPIMRN